MDYKLNYFAEHILDGSQWIIIHYEGPSLMTPNTVKTDIYEGQANRIPAYIKKDNYKITHLELVSHTIKLTVTK
jgi:hypothetical protein